MATTALALRWGRFVSPRSRRGGCPIEYVTSATRRGKATPVGFRLQGARALFAALAKRDGENGVAHVARPAAREQPAQCGGVRRERRRSDDGRSLNSLSWWRQSKRHKRRRFPKSRGSRENRCEHTCVRGRAWRPSVATWLQRRFWAAGRAAAPGAAGPALRERFGAVRGCDGAGWRPHVLRCRVLVDIPRCLIPRGSILLPTLFLEVNVMVL